MATRTHVFTPFPGDAHRLGPLDREGRVRLQISDADFRKVGRGCAWEAEITDVPSGRKFLVRDADCGAPHCRCAAVIVREV